MSKRLVDTEIWDKEWFMTLSPKLKCLVKFVFAKCDIAGIWEANWILASTYIGENCSEKELLSINGGAQFVKLESGKIFCPDFIFFQNGILGNKSPIHLKIKDILSKNNIPYPYPINRVLDTHIVIVKERVIVEEVVDKGGMGGKINVREKVFLKSQEIEKLQTIFGLDYERALDVLENYKQSSGKNYKSDYHALIGWVKEKILGNKKISKAQQNIEITNQLINNLNGTDTAKNQS